MTSGFYLKPRDIVVLPTPSQNTRGLVHPGLGSSLEPFVLKGLLLGEEKRPPAGNSGPRGRPRLTLRSPVAPFCGDSVISQDAHLFGTQSERRSEKLSICCRVSRVRSGSRLSESAVVKMARKEQCACCGEKAGPLRSLMGPTVCPAGGLISAPRFIILVCVLLSELTALHTHRKYWGPPVCCTVLPGGCSGGEGAPQCGLWNLPCSAARNGALVQPRRQSWWV